MQVELNVKAVELKVIEIKNAISEKVLDSAKKVQFAEGNIRLLAMQMSENAFRVFKSKVESEFSGNELQLANIFLSNLKKHFYSPNLLQKQLIEQVSKLELI